MLVLRVEAFPLATHFKSNQVSTRGRSNAYRRQGEKESIMIRTVARSCNSSYTAEAKPMYRNLPIGSAQQDLLDCTVYLCFC
mmetsp:Transcript_24608/g.47962  ORF Transcript_24608/g.47962 Transcript_24608/m.47962 type:complete len:82 (+) Transcript_24608:1386-1631(+)